jgi:hypothetical protein
MVAEGHQQISSQLSDLYVKPDEKWSAQSYAGANTFFMHLDATLYKDDSFEYVGMHLVDIHVLYDKFIASGLSAHEAAVSSHAAFEKWKQHQSNIYTKTLARLKTDFNPSLARKIQKDFAPNQTRRVPRGSELYAYLKTIGDPSTLINQVKIDKLTESYKIDFTTGAEAMARSLALYVDNLQLLEQFKDATPALFCRLVLKKVGEGGGEYTAACNILRQLELSNPAIFASSDSLIEHLKVTMFLNKPAVHLPSTQINLIDDYTDVVDDAGSQHPVMHIDDEHMHIWECLECSENIFDDCVVAAFTGSNSNSRFAKPHRFVNACSSCKSPFCKGSPCIILAEQKPKLPQDSPRSLRAATYSMWEYRKDKGLSNMKNVEVPKLWIQDKARKFTEAKLDRLGNRSGAPIQSVVSLESSSEDWAALTDLQREAALARADALFFDVPSDHVPDSTPIGVLFADQRVSKDNESDNQPSNDRDSPKLEINDSLMNMDLEAIKEYSSQRFRPGPNLAKGGAKGSASAAGRGRGPEGRGRGSARTDQPELNFDDPLMRLAMSGMRSTGYSKEAGQLIAHRMLSSWNSDSSNCVETVHTSSSVAAMPSEDSKPTERSGSKSIHAGIGSFEDELMKLTYTSIVSSKLEVSTSEEPTSGKNVAIEPPWVGKTKISTEAPSGTNSSENSAESIVSGYSPFTGNARVATPNLPPWMQKVVRQEACIIIQKAVRGWASRKFFVDVRAHPLRVLCRASVSDMTFRHALALLRIAFLGFREIVTLIRSYKQACAATQARLTQRMSLSSFAFQVCLVRERLEATTSKSVATSPERASASAKRASAGKGLSEVARLADHCVSGVKDCASNAQATVASTFGKLRKTPVKSPSNQSQSSESDEKKATAIINFSKYLVRMLEGRAPLQEDKLPLLHDAGFKQEMLATAVRSCGLPVSVAEDVYGSFVVELTTSLFPRQSYRKFGEA